MHQNYLHELRRDAGDRIPTYAWDLAPFIVSLGQS
jgi:hypothetical protein